MTTFQKTVKYVAMAFAVFLAVSIIGGVLSMFGLLSGFFGGDAVADNVKTYAVSSDINVLDVKINAADFQIKQGDAFSVESNLKHLTVKEENGVLTIKETKKFGGIYTGAILTFYIPADTVFEIANIVTGAGRFTVDCLSADNMNFELGAGEVTINSLIATKSADIEGGAGKIMIADGALHNLDFEMGVGQLNLTATLTGDCNLDSGVGEMNATLLGNKDDYKLELEKGIGNISVDGDNISGNSNIGNGNNEVKIHGGVGSISVKFKDKFNNVID